MGITCEVVRDLLPLYHDNVCSKDSRKIIEDHLSTCPQCRAELAQIDIEILAGSHTEDIRVISNISKKWKRDILSAFLLGTLLLSILASIGCMVAFKAIGSYVSADGVLVEPFALIPLSFIFGLTAILSGIGLVITYLVKRHRKKK
ncbi:DUF3955 domain-containing protein [Oscillospiraceae bacterium LTW-04]|nr:DUF3955 domain-containing protein [Oscillospiraceae bacterium MB24-C1]